jgi:hypothetical protein
MAVLLCVLYKLPISVKVVLKVAAILLWLIVVLVLITTAVLPAKL